MLTLVYQAYGRQDIVNQTVFSAVSLLFHNSADIRIVIYTDQGKQLKGFFSSASNVDVIEITPEILKKWRGEIDFVHRVKIECLIDAGKKHKGTLFYCDGDTVFLTDPQKLFLEVNDQKSVMHIAENTLKEGKDPLSKKLKSFVKKNFFELENGVITIPENTMMWNAGVIGVSEKNKGLLSKILNLTDVAYRKYQKHVIEQLAVSFFLQKATQITSAHNEILHYWNQKEEYQKKIDEFLFKNTNLETAIKNYASFKLAGPPKPKKKGLAKIIEKLRSNF